MRDEDTPAAPWVETADGTKWSGAGGIGLFRTDQRRLIPLDDIVDTDEGPPRVE